MWSKCVNIFVMHVNTSWRTFVSEKSGASGDWAPNAELDKAK